MAIDTKAWCVRFLEPSLYDLETITGVRYSSNAARFLTAIALQESGLKTRHQYKGPAHGFFQFEQFGGCGQILINSRTKPKIEAVFEHQIESTDLDNAFECIQHNNLIMVAFARLLVWQDPAALPTDANTAWKYYLRNWRPGKPHPKAWADNWKKACDVYPLEG